MWPLEAPADGGEKVPPRRGMIWIPAGTLIAGTPKDRTPRVADEELTGEPVALHGFYIDEFAYPNEAGAIPKTGMSQIEAAGLCAAQEKRLCTELEWERACKGPTNSTYEYGDTYRAAECTMGVQSKLSPAGLRIGCKSAFGVHDLHGGPWEWTASVWRRGGDSTTVAVRGGNAEAGELVGRCANAMNGAPSSRRPDIGVRCCAGPSNTAEVVLAVTRGKTLEPRFEDPEMDGHARRGRPRKGPRRAPLPSRRFASTGCGSGILWATRSWWSVPAAREVRRFTSRVASPSTGCAMQQRATEG